MSDIVAKCGDTAEHGLHTFLRPGVRTRMQWCAGNLNVVVAVETVEDTDDDLRARSNSEDEYQDSLIEERHSAYHAGDQ